MALISLVQDNLLATITILVAIAGILGASLREAIAGRRSAAPPDLKLPPSKGRFADVNVFRAESADSIGPQDVISDNEIIRVRVSIGELSTSSIVLNPTPIRAELPDSDRVILVALTSTDFLVRRPASIEDQQLIVPSGLSGATTPSGQPFVEFLLYPLARRGAQIPGGQFRARVTLYFRGAAVQSIRIDTYVGSGRQSGIAALVDFTSSRDFRDVGQISDVDRLTLMLNSGPGESARIQVQIPAKLVDDENPTPIIDEFIPNAAGLAMLGDELRGVLAAEAIAPTALVRRRAQTIRDLKAIAPLGWRAYSLLCAAVRNLDGYLARSDPEGTVLQICQTTGSGMSFPWNFLYRYPLPVSASELGSIPRCRTLEEQEDPSTFVYSGRLCPYEAEHVGPVLCPFGFLGIRHKVEQLVSGLEPCREISAVGDEHLTFAVSERIDKKQVAAHLESIVASFQAHHPNSQPLVAYSRDEVHKALMLDRPFVYFLCHGELQSRAVHLSVGRRDSISPSDVVGWVTIENRTRRPMDRPMWTEPRPLIFVNACGSLQLGQRDLIGYLDAFVGAGRAAGLVGTEVKVNPGLAMAFADRFYSAMTFGGKSVGDALHAARLHFLGQGNLFGLLYSGYSYYDMTANFGIGNDDVA